MRKITPLLLSCVLLPPGCGPVSPPIEVPVTKVEERDDPAVEELLGLMRKRLDVMHDVARWKWAAKAPIEDPKREAASLDDVAERAKGLGLDPAVARTFFAAQIEAAKVVQRADFRRWEADKHGPEGKAPDLAGVLRPKIDGLNRDLLAALPGVLSLLRDDDGFRLWITIRAETILAGEGIDDDARSAAIRPLVEAPAPGARIRSQSTPAKPK
ncbi:gamma subclass chorismate mutase AroQ [Singulisphaera sp. PoT]|uniref:gamma subclass chorismate mutase AroQ n=1 Tax=Singulisphaera sp. PoT TaxID=3411797 RepID=UPI003BF4B845